MQTVIVWVIVGATAFFAGRWIVRTLKGKGGCGCGCDHCPKGGGGQCSCGEIHLPDIKPDGED